MAQKIYRVIPLQYEQSSCGDNSLPRSVWTEHFSLHFWLLPSFSSLELSLTLEFSSSNTLSAYWKKKKRRERRLKPSNTWLVLAFVCFRVWERSKGDIDERKIATIVSQSMKQRNYPHQVPCILTWGTGMATWSFGWSGITRGIGSLWRIWSFFFFNWY